MLILLHGNDFKKIKQKAGEFMEKSGQDVSIIRFDQDNFSLSEIENLIQGQGLFEKKRLVVLDHLLSFEELKELLVARARNFAESQNIFVFLETELKEDLLGLFKKEGKFEKFSRPEVKAFNLYSLTDAFGQKNKKKLWALYQKAVLAGFTPEEIQGVLFWQVKNILIAKESKSPSESGLKPFPFKKAKEFSKNFTDEELKTHSTDLVELYHRSHLGQKDFATGLEQFILRI